jgi:hypothetical protein
VAQYKGTIIFSGGDSGWTETYYLLASTPSGAATNLLAVIADRVAIMHSTLLVISAHISDVTIRGDSIVVLSTPEPGDAVDATGYLTLDSAVVVKWQVGVFNRNKTFIRGIPNGQQLDGFTNFDLTFSGLLSTYFATVIANCVFPVTVRNLTPPPAYNVVSYSPPTAGAPNPRIGRRKSGRPIGLPRGRRVAP